MAETTGIDLASVKRKKMLLLVGVLAGVMVLSMLAVWLTSSGDKSSLRTQQSEKIPVTNVATPGSAIKPQDVWRAMSEAQIKNNEKLTKETGDNLKALTDEFNKYKKEKEKTPANIGAKADYPPLPPNAPAGNAGPVPPPRSQVGPERYMPNPTSQPIAGRSGAQGTSQGVAQSHDDNIMTVSFVQQGKPTLGTNYRSVVEKADGKKRERRTVDHYIPSGSFTPARMLAGIDAPTGGQAQQNPQPIVAQLINSTILPNKYKYEAKLCHVTGAGYGDISSERAYIRLEKLSCVLRDGTVIDMPVKGFIADETGRAGIRGRLVTKTGQVLANALIAGIASGIGSAFNATASTTSVSPLGATQTIDSNKIAQAGLGSGIQSAGDKLAGYYIKLADQLFPVIEIDPARVVDVVFTEGVDLGKHDLIQANEASNNSAVAPRANISNKPQIKAAHTE